MLMVGGVKGSVSVLNPSPFCRLFMVGVFLSCGGAEAPPRLKLTDVVDAVAIAEAIAFGIVRTYSSVDKY